MKILRSFACIPFALVFFFMGTPMASAQVVNDSSVVVKKTKKDSALKPVHSPKKAAILSACLPGLGQAYNKKYWKIPVIYAGMGTFTYFIIYTNGQYRDFKKAYIYRTDNNPSTVDDHPDYNESQLKEQVDFYRHYRDLSVILTAAVYTLNIVDANVDAHLFTFDVSNDLSLAFSPGIYTAFTNRPLTSFTFTVKF